jgi:hypothetical protein
MDIPDKDIIASLESVNDEVNRLFELLKVSFKGRVYSDDVVKDALATLVLTDGVLYQKLTSIFKSQSTSKVIEFAALARLLLESLGVISWILGEPGQEVNRAQRYMDTGIDLNDHYNNLTKDGFGVARRTRSRLPSTEKLLQATGIEELKGWYDELNYFIHPSSALMMHGFAGNLHKVLNFGIFIAGDTFAEAILRVAYTFGLPQTTIDAAKLVHTRDIS